MREWMIVRQNRSRCRNAVSDIGEDSITMTRVLVGLENYVPDLGVAVVNYVLHLMLDSSELDISHQKRIDDLPESKSEDCGLRIVGHATPSLARALPIDCARQWNGHWT